MKKIYTLLILFVSLFSFAQVTTTPGTPKANGQITIHLNTTGTDLEGYTGDIYAHTGVTVNGAQWQNVIGTWGDNSVQPKFTNTGTNTYDLVLSPNLYTYYGVNTADEITEINLVARSADGNTQTNPDIHITVYGEELAVQITAPTNQSVYNNGETITISGEATKNASLELFVNNTSIQTASATKTISTSYTFSTTGQHTIKVTANDGTTTKQHEISVYVRTPTQTATLPSGAKNGVTVNTDGTVTFVLWAPQKNDVFLLGDFNNWSINQSYQLKKDGEKFWITLSGLDANTEYAYQFLVDYDKTIVDPYATKVLDKSNDQYISATNYPDLMAFPNEANGTIVATFKINDPAYTWANTSFTKPAKEKLVIYELLVRDFSDSDSYQAIIDKLDYLEGLGVNAIEFMPVNEFEGNDSWGYNPSHFFALDKAYGTKNKFKELVDKCHQRGIAVILDVVFNHAFSQNPLVQMYDYNNNGTTTNNPFFNDDHNFYEGSMKFGFDFNHESTYTQQYIKDIMSYWINEYKVDGFRLDFTKGFTNQSYGAGDYGSAYNQARIDRLTDYANYVWSNHGNDTYMILEHLADNSEEKVLANNGIMIWGNMNHNYNQSTMGWGTENDISWGYYQSRGYNNQNLVTYMESHDEERLMYKNLQHGNASGSYDVKNLNTALSRQEIGGVFLLAIPGPKMIWQFGELGYDISINHNGRTGRKPVKWEYFNQANRKKIYDVWATIAKLKQQHDVFSTTNVNMHLNGYTKRIDLIGSANKVVIIGNFDVVAQTINPNFPNTGTWHEYFSTTTHNITNATADITLQPGEYRMYSTVAFQNPLSTEEIAILKDETVFYPNPVANNFITNKGIKEIVIYNIMGKKVKIFTKQQATYNVENLAKGMYIIKITDKKNSIYTNKMIKK